jgi:hypothetical protein
VNAVAPADTVLVTVIVSVLASVVIEIPVPAAIVRVSVAESATTFDCPATAIVAKLSDAVPPPAAAIVIVSVVAFVVMVIFEPATKVNVSVAESAITELCPATAMVAKLSDVVPPDTTVQVLSPLKKVVSSLVPDAPNRNTGTVPDVNCVAFRAVRLTPDVAGNVAGKRASGIVPDANCVAFRAVIKLPSPLKLVAVNSPASDMLAELTCMIVPVTPS